jgi:ribonuclease P protein subunit RPR2
MVIKSGPFVRGIASQRIEILYMLAKKEYESDPKLSVQYVRLIKQISRHYKVGLPEDFKRGVCKKCSSILVPGKSSRVRLASSKRYVAITCLNCGSEMHVHY